MRSRPLPPGWSKVKGTERTDDVPPLTPAQIRELERRLLDLKDRTRFLLVSATAHPNRTVGVDMMPYDVIEARHVGGFVLWLRFRDGTVGEIDLTAELHGPVFEPLRDPTTFRTFQVHQEFHTVTWPNGADFAPEFLHDNVRITA